MGLDRLEEILPLLGMEICVEIVLEEFAGAQSLALL
jgi:hypothetical protein